MDFAKINSVLESIFSAMDTEEEMDGEGIDEKAVAAMIEGLYESAVAKYRPVIHTVAPLILRKISQDLGPLIASLMTPVTEMGNATKENAAYQTALTRSNELSAKQRISKIRTYQKAGFTRQEAMRLLLMDMANLKAISAAVLEAPDTISKIKIRNNAP